MKTIKVMIALLALTGCTGVITGCTTLIPAPEAQISAAKSPPHSDRAKLIVFRIKAFKAGGAKTPVFIDGRLLGYNRSGTFIVSEVSAGNHTISTGVSRIDFAAQAGQTYYFRQSPKLAWISEEADLSTVEIASPADGAAHISGAQQAAAMF
jgi:uncharacterized protein DUF2846